VPTDGMLMDTGAEAALEPCDGDAGGEATAESLGDTGTEAVAVSLTGAGVPTLCDGVLVPQPVRSSKATAADANRHLRRALVEPVIRSSVSDLESLRLEQCSCAAARPSR
jgi:hypothetical protein